MLTDLFEMILAEKNDEALSMVKSTIQSVKNGNVDISELVISKSCKGLDAYENPDRMTNVQAAKKLIKLGYEFIPGMKVSWVVTDSKSSPQTVEPYISGVPFTAKPDYKYYAERLSQTASRITEVFGWEEKDLLMGNQQATLFSGKFAETSEAPKKKKEPVEEKPKAKTRSLDDFF